MSLPLVINPGDLGHIGDHEEIDALLDVVSPFNLAQDSQGLLAARPAAGRRGRYYLATDISVLFRDSGTAWVEVWKLMKTFLIDLLAASANVNSIRVPAFRGTKAGVQSVPGNALTVVTIDVEVGEGFDNDGMHSLVTNNPRITAQRAGLYLVGGDLHWALNATSIRTTVIRKNGSLQLVSNTAPGDGTHTTSCEAITLCRLAAGEYVEVLGYQDTGGALNVLADSHFWAVFQSAL